LYTACSAIICYCIRLRRITATIIEHKMSANTIAATTIHTQVVTEHELLCSQEPFVQHPL
jgi:hypothetical protein